MKKLLTGIASVALVLVGGVTLASCGGVGNIVDTSGNYQKVEFTKIQQALTSYKESAEGYEFIAKLDGGLNADLAKLEGSASYSGLVEVATGNFYIKGDLHMSGSFGSEAKISVDSSGDIYVDAANQTAYRNINGEKTQGSVNTSDSLFESAFSDYGNIIFGLGFDDYFMTEETGAEYQMATSDDYVKIMVKITEQVLTDKDDPESVQEEATTIHLIMDAEGNMQGFSFEFKSADEHIIIQSKASTKKVEFPTNVDDYLVTQ